METCKYISGCLLLAGFFVNTGGIFINIFGQLNAIQKSTHRHVKPKALLLWNSKLPISVPLFSAVSKNLATNKHSLGF